MKHLYVNEELKMVENENDFSELIRENMGDDSERYFQEILEQHDNENDKVYYDTYNALKLEGFKCYRNCYYERNFR